MPFAEDRLAGVGESTSLNFWLHVSIVTLTVTDFEITCFSLSSMPHSGAHAYQVFAAICVAFFAELLLSLWTDVDRSARWVVAASALPAIICRHWGHSQTIAHSVTYASRRMCCQLHHRRHLLLVVFFFTGRGAFFWPFCTPCISWCSWWWAVIF